MSPLPLIPRPWKQRLRAFRLQGVPVLVFLAAVAGILVTWREWVTPRSAPEREPVLVRIAPVTNSIAGSVRQINSAHRPDANGRL